jgi:hypothetical protein
MNKAVKTALWIVYVAVIVQVTWILFRGDTPMLGVGFAFGAVVGTIVFSRNKRV